MSVDRYQKWTDETAIYPEAGTGSMLALAYVGLGLGEAGEVQGKIKKILRDGNGVIDRERRTAILDEASDVMWYLARLLRELGADFHELMAINQAKLNGRLERGTIGGSGDVR